MPQPTESARSITSPTRFPSGLPAPYGNDPSALPGNNTGSGPLSIELGQSISGNPRKQSDAYQENWSLDVQRSLPAHFVVTAAYVGSIGVHLLGAIQLNQLTDANLALGSGLNKVVPNPFYNVITDSSSLLSKSTIQQGYLLRAYPQFLNFELLNSGWGHSNYQAGQLTVEHRLSQGLSMLLGYTYSKTMDDVGESGTTASIQDNGCHACEWSIADLDQTNVLRVSGLYELPFGPQKQFLNQGLLGRLVGGWELGGTYQYDTGQPLALTSPIQSASLNGGRSPPRHMNRCARRWFPVKASRRRSSIQKRASCPASTRRPLRRQGRMPSGMLHGICRMCGFRPSTELDALLEKNTKINERMGFTVRFEALNALNTRGLWRSGRRCNGYQLRL